MNPLRDFLSPGLPLGLVAILLLVGCQDPDPSAGQDDREMTPPEAHTPPDRQDPTTTPEEEGWPRTLQDQAGRTLELTHPPVRIVSLVPAATAILLELGATDRLVGRTDYDDAPTLEDVPSVGGGLNPSIERLVVLEPELVVRFEGQQDRATPRALDRAGITHLAVRPDGIDDIREMALLLGRALGRMERARELLTRMDQELEEVRDRVAHAPRPRVAFLLGGDPPWVVGPGTFLHELLEIAGGENALAELEAPLYAPVSVEEILRQEVDLILALEGAQIPSALRRLPLVQLPEGVQSPGVDIGRSAREISRKLHPEEWR